MFDRPRNLKGQSARRRIRDADASSVQEKASLTQEIDSISETKAVEHCFVREPHLDPLVRRERQLSLVEHSVCLQGIGEISRATERHPPVTSWKHSPGVYGQERHTSTPAIVGSGQHPIDVCNDVPVGRKRRGTRAQTHEEEQANSRQFREWVTHWNDSLITPQAS